MPRDRLYSVVCALLVIASVLLTMPFLEMGTNDDWSYVWVARVLADTGHLVYNGWIGAMIGVQAAWAALLIRLFGFSFTLVRLSTLPFGAGCAVLLYRLGRSAGLNATFAMFGTLSVVLSPVFIPVAASFMTDVPGYFFWLASVWCAMRATDGSSQRSAMVWLAACAAAGIAGGTIRQVVWFVPLLVLPAAAWIRRSERAVVWSAAAAWVASAAGMALCLRWYAAQPYVTPLPSEAETWIERVQDTGESVLQIAQGCLLFLLPVTALFFAAWRETMRQFRLMVWGAGITALLLAGTWWLDWDLAMGNIVTPAGILHEGVDLLGTKPETLTAPVRWLLGTAVFGAGTMTAASLLAGIGWWRKTDWSLRRFAVFYGPVCLVYTAAIIYRSVTTSLMFDRYYIVLFPLFIVPLLRYFQASFRESPPGWAWATVAVFALYGVGLTHDYLAACRARLAAANHVVASGIPRNHVSAGLEYDGWTQLELTGRVATERDAPKRQYRIPTPYWFWDKTPDVNPEYVVTYARVKGLADSQFPPVPYTAWLPPFRRQVIVQKME